jgi:DNA-binding SARP family transcriptional activator
VDRARSLAEQDLAAAAAAYRAAIAEFGEGDRVDAPEVLLGLPGLWADGERDRLQLEFKAAVREKLDVDIQLGGHDAALPALTRLTQADILDERVAELYLIALYRARGQSAALEHYQLLRVRLLDELGADPAPAVRDLHARILAQDASLDPPPSRTAAGAAAHDPAADQGPAGTAATGSPLPTIHAQQIRTVIGGSVTAGRDINF